MRKSKLRPSNNHINQTKKRERHFRNFVACCMTLLFISFISLQSKHTVLSITTKEGQTYNLGKEGVSFLKVLQKGAIVKFSDKTEMKLQNIEKFSFKSESGWSNLKRIILSRE